LKILAEFKTSYIYELVIIVTGDTASNQQTDIKKQNMRKLVAAINMTLDGFCDHTAIIPDEEMHQHYADLLNNAGTALYGRITYQLMEYWQTVVKNPTGNKAMDEFALVIDRIPKIVFSRTLKSVEWESAKLATQGLKEEVLELRQQAGKDILVGSPGLIVALTQLGLIDEYQLCVHPVIAGGGLPLFKNINDRIILKLLKTKSFGSGAIVLYYEPTGQ
jgi:dihydrofolate reductase